MPEQRKSPEPEKREKRQYDCSAQHGFRHQGLESLIGMGCTRALALRDLQKNIWTAILEKRTEFAECSSFPCRRGGRCRTRLETDLDTIPVSYATIEIDDCPDRLGWECTVVGELSIRSYCYCQ